MKKMKIFSSSDGSSLTPRCALQDGSRITPAPYEKAQASEEICKRAAHPSSKLNQKKCRVACACLQDPTRWLQHTVFIAPIPTFVLILSRRSRIRARIGHHRTLFVYTRECMLCEPTPVIQCLDRSMRRHSTIADIAYCLYHTRRCAYTRTYTTCKFLFKSSHLSATPVTLCAG